MTIHTNLLHETVVALREGRRDPTAYAETCLDRLDDLDSEVRAFLPEEDRRARVVGAVAECVDRYSNPGDRPPLFCVPVGVKDIFHVDGFETRAGSDLPGEILGGPQSDAVTALIDAGAVVLGKTVTTEFAYFDPGPTRNPHDTDHTPGGSSSGSAAAVAAGMTPLALGSQTVGSIIRPASFCGIVGVKPTYGRIPIGGVLPLSPSADHVGYFTQDVSGARHAASVLYDEWAYSNIAIDDRPILGVPNTAYLSQASASTSRPGSGICTKLATRSEKQTRSLISRPSTLVIEISSPARLPSPTLSGTPTTATGTPTAASNSSKTVTR